MSHIIGEITLNVSFVLYLFLCLPQVIHNLRYKNTKGLSLWMHVVFTSSYILDLMYGFGLHMQLQYRLVTLVGLCGLAIQHVQLGLYQKRNWHYVTATVFLLSLLIFSLSGITVVHYSRSVYDSIGMIDQVLAVMYMLPQILKNSRLQSIASLCVWFILIDMMTACLDTVTAFALHWDYPSKVGPPIILLVGCILIWQFYRYRNTRLSSVGYARSCEAV